MQTVAPRFVRFEQTKQSGGDVIEIHAFDTQEAQSEALARAVG
ncbi:hypothetical protein BURCENBC7_AP5651, partial [Burkholderia cenocepacia BC7]